LQDPERFIVDDDLPDEKDAMLQPGLRSKFAA